jgi:hypothetical protein
MLSRSPALPFFSTAARSTTSPRAARQGLREKSEPLQSGAVYSRRNIHEGRRWPAAMYSIFYIIGVIVVVLAILSLLGLA